MVVSYYNIVVALYIYKYKNNPVLWLAVRKTLKQEIDPSYRISEVEKDFTGPSNILSSACIPLCL